jgi:hypothetical protein
VGLATMEGLAEISAGVLGTAATWVASTGSRAAGREVQTPRLAAGACERQARVFWGGALRCLACSEAAPQKNKKLRLSLDLFPRQHQHRVIEQAEAVCPLGACSTAAGL